jgi:hypothetical protein
LKWRGSSPTVREGVIIGIGNEYRGDHLTVRSGKDGRFRVKLAPGKHKLTPISPNPGAPPHAPPPLSLTVESGRYTHVTVRYDSGIR